VQRIGTKRLVLGTIVREKNGVVEFSKVHARARGDTARHVQHPGLEDYQAGFDAPIVEVEKFVEYICASEGGHERVKRSHRGDSTVVRPSRKGIQGGSKATEKKDLVGEHR
jgi:hypothetical protein